MDLSILFSSSRRFEGEELGRRPKDFPFSFHRAVEPIKDKCIGLLWGNHFPFSFHRAAILKREGFRLMVIELSILFSSSSAAFFAFLAIYLPV